MFAHPLTAFLAYLEAPSSNVGGEINDLQLNCISVLHVSVFYLSTLVASNRFDAFLTPALCMSAETISKKIRFARQD